MAFIIAILVADFLLIFVTLYLLDDERKLPRIEKSNYADLKYALLGFEDGQKMYAFFCSEDRAIFAAKLLLYGKDGNKYFNFARSFGIDPQDLVSYENTLITLANIDYDLAHDFVGLIILEADSDYIRVNAVPYRFQLL